MTETRLLQYGEEYASRFKSSDVANAYRFRPPYPEEVYDTLLGLMGASSRRVLDVGCGPGKIARGLIDRVERVDAVDFSTAMIEAGKREPKGDHPGITWIAAPAEGASLSPPYALIVAGASIHWMDWQVVFPKFREALAADGHLAIVDGDRPFRPPWREAEMPLISRFSTNRHYQEIDLIRELEGRGHFVKLGEKVTAPVEFTQSLQDYIASFHSRASLSRGHMTEEDCHAFDAQLTGILEQYTDDRGHLRFQINTRITWGKAA